MPITGTSMAYTFDDGDCPTQKPVQYFEMMGNRALWLDGWMAVTRHDPDDDYNDDEWELYYLDEDFSQSNNLAKAEPNQLKKLIERWWVEADAMASCLCALGCHRAPPLRNPIR